MVSVRPARVDDATGIVRIAAMLYESIGEPAHEDWLLAAALAIRDRLDVDLFSWVAVDDAGWVMAAASATLTTRLPTPSNPSGAVAYVQWVGTESASRRQGLARQIMTAMLEHFDARGVHDVQLHSTLAAEPLYRSLGFVTGALRPLRRSPCVGE